MTKNLTVCLEAACILAITAVAVLLLPFFMVYWATRDR